MASKRTRRKFEQAEVEHCVYPRSSCCKKECNTKFSAKEVARLRRTCLKYSNRHDFLMQRQKVETCVRRTKKAEAPSASMQEDSDASLDLDASSEEEEVERAGAVGSHTKTRYFVDNPSSLKS